MQNNQMQAERDLANLVNMAGKMRMLSHRTVMFALLVSIDPTVAQARDKALQDFSSLYSVLANPRESGGLCPASADALAKVNAITPPQLEILASFIDQCRDALAARRNQEQALKALGDFVAGDLLATLNAINDGIRRALEYVAEQRVAAERPIVSAIKDTLGQIDRLASSLRMVATNASLEAQRSGEAGRVFRVLSEEMRTLSDQSRASANNLGNLLSRVQS